MIGTETRSRYFDVIDKYLRREIGSEEFCTEFISVWRFDRDRTYSQKQSWPQPFDELLLASWQRKEITDEEFREKSAELWGYSDDPDFRDTMDALNSTCSVFNPTPAFEWELDENHLRQEVVRLVHDYRDSRQ